MPSKSLGIVGGGDHPSIENTRKLELAFKIAILKKKMLVV